MDKCTDVSQNPHFDVERPTAIYVHGFRTNQQNADLNQIVESFVFYKNFNMMTLDWDRFAYLDYYKYASPLASVVRFTNPSRISNEFHFLNLLSVRRMVWPSLIQLQHQKQWHI